VIWCWSFVAGQLWREICHWSVVILAIYTIGQSLGYADEADARIKLRVLSTKVWLLTWFIWLLELLSILCNSSCMHASGVASGPAVPPGGTRNFKQNEEMLYSEAKLTAFLILKIYIIMIIFQCFHLFI
jgi:hypothetical protein